MECDTFDGGSWRAFWDVFMVCALMHRHTNTKAEAVLKDRVVKAVMSTAAEPILQRSVLKD